MKRILIISFFSIGLWLGILGCSSTPEQVTSQQTSVNTPQKEVKEKTIPQEEILLPLNYSKTNYRKLLMGVAFESVSGKDLATGRPLPIAKDLSTRLQTEMAKLKRFTIFSAHNREGVTFFQELSDIDSDVKIASADQVREMDVILSGCVTVTKERQELYKENQIIYEVECDFSCEDMRTRTVKFAEKAKGSAVRRHLLTFAGMPAVGYSEADEQQAITQAAMQALAALAQKLGNTYPVGGEITGISLTGERMQLNKGFEDGIGNRQKCIVYVDDGGIDIPIAVAEATPSPESSNLRISRWNKSDRDAKPLIEALEKNPKDFIKQNKVYAVGHGMPIPTGWDSL